MASALAFPLGFTLTSLRILDVDRRLGERRIREVTDARVDPPEPGQGYGKAT